MYYILKYTWSIHIKLYVNHRKKTKAHKTAVENRTKRHKSSQNVILNRLLGMHLDAHGMFYLVHILTYASNDFIKIRIIFKTG